MIARNLEPPLPPVRFRAQRGAGIARQGLDIALAPAPRDHPEGVPMRQHWMCPSCGNTLTISDIPFEFARITGAECSRCHVEMIGEPLEVVLHRD